MQPRYLVTGGAGFIGTRLVGRLQAAGAVHVFDSLHPQVHGPNAPAPSFPPGVRFTQGDVRDPVALGEVLRQARPTVVVHLAAETGTGQSFDEITRYCETNVTGTARLIEAIRLHAPDVKRVVLASSRAVYGEGPYRSADGTVRMAAPRSPARMAAGDFEVRCPETGEPIVGVPANASYGVAPVSVYGATKLMQEYLLVLNSVGARWAPVVLRLQNVFGPGQSLLNPYTGVLSIFCSQLLAGQRIAVFEDGRITRDFVFVDDVVDALSRASDLALSPPPDPLDIGSGQQCTILDAARDLVRHLGLDESRIAISGQFRQGDIRFAAADIARARRELGWVPRVPLTEGLRRLAAWSSESHRRLQAAAGTRTE